MNFLIVDDERLLCNGTARRIRSIDQPEIGAVECAYSGAEALKKLQAGHFHVLFTDIRMEEMDGLQLVEEAKKICPLLVCVIITAFDQFQYAQKAIRLGVFDFLVKPCSERTMKEQAIAAARKAQEIAQAQQAHASPLIAAAPTVDEADKLIRRVEEYVQAHLYDQVDMAIVANHMNLSYSHFSRVFRDATGKTFSRYLIEVRMEEVCRLLLSGERLVRIAELLGYHDAGNLTRCFTKEYGLSPSQWLKEKKP